jgi:3-deoxy-D-manno-octulosonic-acid transferase
MSPRPLALRFYGQLFEALTPLWHWWLKQRLQRGKETLASLDQRWMRHPPPRLAGPLVWGHAVGVGEALALAGLLKRLHEQRPDLHFLITTTARTSGQALAKQELGPQFTHWFAPVDTPSNVARFVQHWQPDLALWCEMDLWPSLIDATAQRGTPHLLVNARLSAAAAAKRRWGRALYAPLLAGFDAIWAQNAESAQHLQRLGALPQRVDITGTIKAMVPPLAANPLDVAAWSKALGERRAWVLASSHPGEEELALAAHKLLRDKHPDALLILAPRDVGRGGTVAALCGPDTPLRSQGALLPGSAPCYVADTMGELGLWYRLSQVAMVGGSWAPVGGHNPFEATALGNTVLHGPHVANFSESYADLDAQGLSLLALSAEQLATAVTEVWAANSENITCTHASNERSTAHIQQLLALLPPAAPAMRPDR